MIVLDTPAKMKCDHDPCDATLTVCLVVQGGGGFGILPPTGHGWQVALLGSGVFATMCPDHRQTVLTPERKLERIQ